MALHFCKNCGTVYDDRVGGCPKCETREVMDKVIANEYEAPAGDMSEAEVRAARKRSWIQLVIGIPAFIGFIYLIIYVMQIIKGG